MPTLRHGIKPFKYLASETRTVGVCGIRPESLIMVVRNREPDRRWSLLAWAGDDLPGPIPSTPEHATATSRTVRNSDLYLASKANAPIPQTLRCRRSAGNPRHAAPPLRIPAAGYYSRGPATTP